MYEEAFGLSTAGRIDNIENLKNDQVYIFQGLLDSIVPWGKFKLKKLILPNFYLILYQNRD